MNVERLQPGFEKVLFVAGLGLICWWGSNAIAAHIYQAEAEKTFEHSRAARRPAFQIAGPIAFRSQLASTQIVGRVVIPGIGLSAIIAEGTDPRLLDYAVGHVRGTALPGTSGNVGIAGHRDTFFRRLGRVRPGDLIRITTLDGAFDYRVVLTSVVSPRNVQVLEDGPCPMLTLVTCYPFHVIGPAPNRFIVKAERV